MGMWKRTIAGGTYPAFEERHILVGKLRCLIYISFWILILGFAPWVLTYKPVPVFLVSLTFAFPTVCYTLIHRHIAVGPIFTLEMITDIIAQSCLLYLAGGKHDMTVLYILYTIAGGTLYNFRVAVFVASMALTAYGSFLALTQLGWLVIPQFPLELPALFDPLRLGPWGRAGLLLLFLVIALYGMRIVALFASQRERVLEKTNREVTELLARLQVEHAELERVSKVKSEFLATMSHELRTPLTAIIGFSELMVEEVMGKMNEEQKDSMREVLANGEHLLSLINSLLDFSKIEAGKMELKMDPVSVADLVLRVERSLSPLFLKKDQSFSAQVARDIPIIWADEKRLQQILLNLLSNAIKFTPMKGSIGLEARFYRHLNELPMAAALFPNGTGELFAGGVVAVSVTDSGIGIDRRDLPLIFESFHQVDRSMTRQYEGTGLGLALTRQFVELHGGKIWVESIINQGSRFTFVLPARGEPPAEKGLV